MERTKAQSPAASTSSSGHAARDEAVAAKLLDSNVELSTKHKIIVDLRDNVEHLSREQQSSFTRHILPALMTVLKTGKVSFMIHSTEYKYRHALLSTLLRLSSIEVFRPHAVEMASLCIQLMRDDAEANAVLAVKILVDLFRTHKELLQPKAPDVIQAILDVYAAMPSVVSELFDKETASSPGSHAQTQQATQSSDVPTPPSQPSTQNSSQGQQPVPPGQRSFTILWEVPIAVVFLFQSYKDLVQSHAKFCIPRCFEFLQLHPQAQDAAHQAAEAAGEIQVGPCAALESKRQLFSDYVSAQVKTVSFVAYVLRSGAMGELTAEQRTALPQIIVRVFKDLPVETSQHRKDMFIAARHLISTDVQSAFLPYVEEFMDDRILLGQGITAHQSLHSLSLTVCADFAHHLRQEFSLQHLNIIVHKMVCHVHDLTIPLHHQTMCARVLTQLIPLLLNKHAAGSPEDKSFVESLFQLQLETFLRKIEGLSEIRSEWDKWQRRRPAGSSQKPEDEVDVERRKVVDTVYCMSDNPNDPPFHSLRESRLLFKACCVSSRQIINMMKQVGMSMPDPPKMARFFAAGVRCMSVFDFSGEAARNEVKEIFEAFSDLFTGMDVLSFSAIWELTVMYRNDHPKKVEQELKAQEEKEEGDKAEMPPDVPTPALPTSSAATQQAGPASATLKPPASAVDKESEEPPTPADPTAIPVDNSKGAEESSGIPPEKPARLLELFIEEALYTSPDLTIILQSLLSNREFSQCLVGILLRHLVTLLPDLGCRGSVYSHVVVRLFKLSFMAVTLYSEVNESVLLPHCNHILMQCLKLANHSKQPMGYYMLLRNLFRSIGGGRFERIFKAVLPMLSPMLDQLQKLIDSNEGSTRDLFVELTLTVPVRLSVLLPYLGYLMKPLRLALDSGPELIAQGLRTLELCVDNLTHDFLNPFLRPFLDDVLSALWKLLRPSPLISPSFSHQALRILGKLGGRSRSLINRPKLKWTNASPGSQAMLPLQFDGQYDQSVPLKPLVELALKSLQRGDKLYRQNAFSFLKSTSALFLQSKLAPGENEEVFALLIQGLFDCAKTPDCKEEASIFLVDYLSFVVTSELSGDGDGNISKQYLPLTSALLDALAETFATATGKDLDLVVERTGVFVTRLVHHSDIPSSRTMPVIRQLSSRLSSLCYEPSRNRKMGGLAGLQMLFNKLGEPVDSNSWLQHHELEMVRSLLFMLKDLGPEFSPSQVQEVKDFFKAILYQVQLPSADAPAEAMARVNYFVGLFMNELPSQSDTAREAGKMAIGIMAERLQVTVHELLKPHLSRLLLPIYNRPLRALAFHMQIGHIDALTYLLTLEQPLVEFGELPRGAQDNGTPNASSTPQSTAPTGESNATELQPTDGNTNQGTAVSPGQSQRPQPSRTPQLSVPFQMTRLLVEVIGIADAEDTALVQKANPIKSADLLAQLRIVCVKFLAAALDAPELATQRHAPTRSRILAVNFKLLYKPREDVVDVAYNCLKNVKALQSKLPKEMLQAGLRPILANLADARKLDVPCLEGLARLLELLQHYFKVEIGQKLLEHYRAISNDRAALERCATNPPSEHNELALLSRIVNIFHLLPYPAAGAFLRDLCQCVVTTESSLLRYGPTVFTEPLAKYLDRYPVEAAEFFFEKMAYEPPYATTFQAVLASGHAPALRHHLIETASSRLPFYLKPHHEGEKPRGPYAALHAAQVLLLLCRGDATWIREQATLIAALVTRWISPQRKLALQSRSPAVAAQLAEDDVILGIFYLVARLVHVDVLFHVIEFLSTPRPADTFKLRHFLSRTVVMSKDTYFKTIVLDRFFDIFENPSFPRLLQEVGLRHLINPMLLIACNRDPAEEILSQDCIAKLGSKVWQQAAPQVQQQKFSPGLRIELMLLTSLLARHRRIPDNHRSMAVKFGASNGADSDALVQQVSHGVIVDFTITWSTEIPFRILLKLYGQLLKAHGPESRLLSRASLDQLAGVFTSISEDLYKDDTPTEKQQQIQQQQQAWLKSTRMLLVEEGLSQLTQLVHILHFIVRNPDLFYLRRDQFVSLIVVSLPRLATSAASNLETRGLALDLYSLLLRWEQKRVSLAAQEENAMIEDTPEPSTAEHAPKSARHTSSSAFRLWQIPSSQRDTIVHGLMKMITYMSEPIQRSQSLLRQAMLLLRGFLAPDIFRDANIRLGTFAALRADVTSSNLHLFVNSAEILCIVIEHESDEWVATHLPIIQQFLEKGMSSSFDAAHQALTPALIRIFALLRDVPTPAPVAIAQDPEAPAASTGGTGTTQGDTVMAADAPETPEKQFLSWAVTHVEKSLSSQQNSLGTVALLVAMSKCRPDRIDVFLTQILRLLNRVVKEHLSGQVPQENAETSRQLIESCIHLLSLRVAHLGEQWRWLLNSLLQLADRSPSIPLCRFLLGLLSGWVFETSETAAPSVKDKGAILLKMCSFENRGDSSLLHDFLQLILRIYREPAFQRSELTFKLENAFLLGCRSRDAQLRTSFLDIFNDAVSRTLFTRLHYILGVQNWEALADNWLHQAIDLLLGCASTDVVLFEPSEAVLGDQRQRPFAIELSALRSGKLLQATRRLLYADPHVTQEMWNATFKAAWSCLEPAERETITDLSIDLLSKDHNNRMVDRSPNPIQGIVSGLQACSPTPPLPPHLVRHLARVYNVWYPVIELLQDSIENHREESPAIQDSALDALAELYSDLGEEDFYYGLWRRRAFYPETNIALSFEQAGMWHQAELMYEHAQTKARGGTMHFSQSEYNVWEDHWVLCASKLQQWDILKDLAKYEENADLALDCFWRLSDWLKDREQLQKLLEGVMDTATPRRRIFDVFLALLNSSKEPSEREHFLKNIQFTMDLCLRKWYHLPEVVGQAHFPLLHIFQQVVELQEAAQIFSALTHTNASNLDQKSAELKSILVTWRERLPNEWDDINTWSDLVSWRQHVFTAVNDTYLPLLPATQTSQGAANAPSYAYRGHHETAWIINRFAHVARKHHLMEVCMSSLNKIYTLPNIEIQEAFLKLREQAKCSFSNPAELTTGLEVINNTNLQYFTSSQKAEFFTLKAMFLSQLNAHDEAVQTFSTAVTLDMSFPKAWAQWGEYHDTMFKRNPLDLKHAAHAVSCYLQAASLYKNGKVRRLLIRILWFLSMDDAACTVATAFDSYKGEILTWYWLSLIPQLLLSLSHRESRYARAILMKIARNQPQALFFQLRAAKEESNVVKKQYMSNRKDNTATPSADANGRDEDTEMAPPQGTPQMPENHQHPWDLVEEITSILKTAYPMLALTLETMGDQIVNRFKPTQDEDFYRVLVALCNDAVSQYVSRGPDHEDDLAMQKATVGNINKLIEPANIHPLLRADYEKHFKDKELNLLDYIKLLQRWRDLYENIVDLKARRLNMESVSHWLVEFAYHRLDDVEIPGQYFKNQDNNQGFVKIARFQTKFEFIRAAPYTMRRITMVGTDGNQHPFAVQQPSPRSSRREERIGQCFRLLNATLSTNKDTRRRRIDFNVPVIMPIAAHARLVQNDASMTTFQDAYEQHTKAMGIDRDYPVIKFVDKIRSLNAEKGAVTEEEKESIRLEAFEEVTLKYLPDSLLNSYMLRTMSTAADMWNARKQASLDLGAFIFMTYIFFIGARTPARMSLTRSSGRLWTTDATTNMSTTSPEFASPETVPFRFTPAMQRFVTAIGTEGVLTNSIMAIARALLERDNELEHMLSVFVKEEVISWHHMIRKQPPDGAVRDYTLKNLDAVVSRAKMLSCAQEREQQPVGSLPANQSILVLMAQATNLACISQMDPTYLPWI